MKSSLSLANLHCVGAKRAEAACEHYHGHSRVILCAHGKLLQMSHKQRKTYAGFENVDGLIIGKGF